MSLIISQRIPDGIVVAADSMSTAQNLIEFAVRGGETECPKCNEKIKLADLKFPPVPVPFSASSYTQKLFPLYGKYAVASFGQGIINGKTIYYHIKQFEKENSSPSDLTIVRDSLIKYFENELQAEFPDYSKKAPDKWSPVGFHLNGYEKKQDGKQAGVTYQINLGKENEINRIDSIGCTIAGEIFLVQKLWEVGKADNRRVFKYGLFSLQDAIDLSEFLINATSNFQRFSNEVPTVGGEVDIALLTPFHDFQWIKRKQLMEILGAKETNKSTK